MNTVLRSLVLGVSGWLALSTAASATCRDAVVLVHGNSATPASFENTYDELRRRGCAASEIVRPDWGSKTCAACNDHNGSEETPVLNALVDALARSCTGRIDVVGHSMGVTLAAGQIVRYNLAGSVDSFVGIAGAYRGLRSCGTYPFNVVTSSCGQYGLSIASPMLNCVASQRLGSRMYSIKSWMDQVVCLTGVCTVGGVHASQITGENAGYTYATGHFGLLTDTAVTQANLIQSSAVGESKFRDASAVWTNCQTRRCGNCSAAITAGCSFATSAIRCLTEPAMIGSGSSHVRRASRTSCSGEGCCPRHHWKTP